MEHKAAITPATPESVWVALEKSNADFERRMKESERRREELRTEWECEFDKSRAEFAEQMEQNSRQIGGIESSRNADAIEFFYHSLKYGPKKMFGEEFDEVFKEESRQTKKGFEDEYDILLFNCRAVCIVEVKYKADTGDVAQVLRKERTFRANFPEHNTKKLYLALASMSFHKKTEEACIENSIAIMKQVGDTVVIHDQHLNLNAAALKGRVCKTYFSF